MDKLDKSLVGKKVVLIGKTGYNDKLSYKQMKEKRLPEALEQEKNGYVKISSISYCFARRRYYYVINDNFYNRCDFILYQEHLGRMYAEFVDEVPQDNDKYSILNALHELKFTPSRGLVGDAIRSLYGMNKIMLFVKNIDKKSYTIYSFDKEPNGTTYNVFEDSDGRFYIEVEKEKWTKWDELGKEDALFRTKGFVTQVKIMDCGRSFIGQTKCIDGDEYNLKKGQEIALMDALEKCLKYKLDKVIETKNELTK